jgi:hypothetical protein
MSGINHLAGGVVFTGIYLSLADINIFHPWIFYFLLLYFLCTRISIIPAALSGSRFILYQITWIENSGTGQSLIL